VEPSAENPVATVQAFLRAARERDDAIARLLSDSPHARGREDGSGANARFYAWVEGYRVESSHRLGSWATVTVVSPKYEITGGPATYTFVLRKESGRWRILLASDLVGFESETLRGEQGAVVSRGRPGPLVVVAGGIPYRPIQHARFWLDRRQIKATVRLTPGPPTGFSMSAKTGWPRRLGTHVAVAFVRVNGAAAATSFAFTVEP
jgi:hypothetical protein